MPIVTNTEELKYNLRLKPDFIADTLVELDGSLATYVGKYVQVRDQGNQIFYIDLERGVPTRSEAYNSDHYDAALDAHLITSEPTGFPNRVDSQLSYDDSTRTFTLSPVGDSFSVYIAGEEVRFTSPLSAQIPNVTSIYFFYIDKTSRALEFLTTIDPATFITQVPVSIAYWNAAQGRFIYTSEERHGFMDADTHLHMHQSFGTRWINGLSLANIIADGNGSLDSHAQFGSTSGLIRDEDIALSIPSYAAPGQYPVWYRLGSGQWHASSIDSFPFIYPGKDGYAGIRCAYNLYSGGTWSLAPVANNNFFLVHVVATNDFQQPIIAMLGGTYTSIANARSGAETEFAEMVASGGIPFAEFVALGTVIYQVAGYTNSVGARIRKTAENGDYIDWRTKFSFVASVGDSSFQNLFVGVTSLTDVTYPALALKVSESDPTALEFWVTDGT